jgi:hypothetical protein
LYLGKKALSVTISLIPCLAAFPRKPNLCL